MNKKALFIKYILDSKNSSAASWHTLIEKTSGNTTSKTYTLTFTNPIPDDVNEIIFDFVGNYTLDGNSSAEPIKLDNRNKPLTFNGTYFVTDTGDNTIAYCTNKYSGDKYGIRYLTRTTIQIYSTSTTSGSMMNSYGTALAYY